MKLLRKSCAILLVLSLLLGCLPVLSLAADISTDYTAKIDVSKVSDTQAEVSFIANANGKTVGNGNSVALAYDTSVFTLLNKKGAEQAITNISTNIGNYVGKTVYAVDEFDSFTAYAYAQLSGDGKTGYLLLQPTYSANSAVIATDSVLMSVLFDLAEGATWDSVTTTSIRLLTKEEAVSLEQEGIVVLNDGYTTNYIYGYRNGEDTLAKPAFTYTGFTPAQAVPVCSAPAGISAIYGDTLSSVTLTNPTGNTPGTWTWENESQAVGNVGTNIFTATFTPTDTDTYQTVTGIEVSVKVDPKDLSDVAIGDIPAQPYTGSAIKPTIAVIGNGGITLTKDTDYIVEYDNNINVGTATVTVKATTGGNYTFADETKNFTISKAASAISISGDLNVIYGTAVPTANIQVFSTGSKGAVTYKYFTNEACTEGVSTTAPTDAGSYWVKAYLAADDNYDAAESAALAFTISRKAIEADDFTVDPTDQTYTGSAIEPLVKSDSLKEGTDYTVAYGENTNAGTNAGTITITGIGNYTGSVVKTFTISSKAIAESDFTIDTNAKDYTGVQISPEVSSKVIPTTGYTVAYGANTNAGTGTITITGQGNYTGTITKTFTINKIDYSGAKTQAITVLSSTYDKNSSSSYTADLSALIAPGGALGTPGGMGAMVTGANVSGTSLNITVTPAAAGTEQTITVPVTGCINHNNYAITVTVTSADKQPATVTIAGDTVTYDGQTHELNVQWPDGSGTQTVTYTKGGVTSATAPKDAGTYTVTATYENDTHYGTATATLTIEPLEAVLTWSGTANLVYDGTAKNVTASVSNLVSGDSCAVTVTGGTEKDAGTHTATATSLDNSNYKLPATATQSYTISPKVITFAVTVTPASADYNGAAQTATVTVKDGDAVLESGSDYSVTLPTDMTNAGQKTITVTGAGNYAGSTGSGVFTIEKISQDALTISSVGDKTYGDAPFAVTVGGGTGSGAVTMVSSNSDILSVTKKSEGQFTVTIVGTGTVTLTATKAGDTNHRDTTATLTLMVEKKDISGATVTLPADFHPSYTGSAITIDVTVTLDGVTLVKDKDYNVKYTDNVNAGEATVTVTGIGNYKDTAPSKTFIISKADLSAMKPTVTGTAQVGSTLSASLTGVDAGAITWQWYRGETAIDGATASTYVLVTADSNKEILVKATANTDNYTGTASSDSVQVAKQVITGDATITANSEEVKTGTDLTASSENILPAEARTGGTWQWYRDGSAIDGANTAVYTVTDDDAGTTLQAVFTPNEDFAGTAAASVVVGKIALSGTLTITGDPTVGSALTAVAAGTPSADNYTIQWLRNGAAIPGAEGETYTITKADQGKTISAKLVAAVDGKYTGEVAATEGIAVPAAVPDAPVVTATAASQKVTLVWTVPADNGAAITGYIVQQGDQEAVEVDASITSYVFGNLENGKEYTFTVKAVNSVGSSEAASVTATPKADSSSSGSAGGVVTYTLTFVSNGGTAVKAVTKAVGSVVDLGAYTPTRDGYTFAGWYSEASLTNRVTSVKLDQNRTVYAKWTENTPVSGLPFTDVAGNDWFLEAVTYVYNAGIMNGVTDTTFAPKSFTTRGQIVTMLYRLEGSPAVSGAASFADVSADAYYADPVTWAAANGIVTGFDAATFGPNGNVTREQLAAILYRYAQYKHADVSVSADLSGFADAGSVSSYAVSAMQWAVGAGIINGRGENQLAPSGTATRAEVATMIMRFIENIL